MSSLVPPVRPGRVVGLDVARCLALLGMIATHTLVKQADDGGVTTVQAIAGGRSAALFAVLAGVSLALMSGRTDPPAGRAMRGIRAGLAVRAGLIALVGLVLGSLPTTIAVILAYYGVLFCLGLPFLRLPPRVLFPLAAAWAVVAPVVAHVVRPLLPERELASPDFDSLAEPARLLADLTFTGFYPAFTWLAYLLLGIALGRLDLRDVRLPRVLLVAGAAAAAVAVSVSELLLRLGDARAVLAATTDPLRGPTDLDYALERGFYGGTPEDSWWWLAVHAPHTATPFDLVATGGTAVAVIGACLLVARLAPRAFSLAFGAGAMTLTLYALHVFLRTPEFWPEDGPGTFALHVAVVLAVGAAYRLLDRSGPLERAVASLSDATRRSDADTPTGVRS